MGILKYKQKRDKNATIPEEEIEDRNSNIGDVDMSESKPTSEKILEESSQHDIESTFGNNVVQPKAITNAKVFKAKKQKRKSNSNEAKASKVSTIKDTENYIGYHPKDHHTEAGYSLMKGFEAQASNAVLDFTGDDDSQLRKKKNLMRWDKKKRKYVKAEQDDQKKIKTESGVWIPASYKSDRFKKWKQRSRVAQMQEHDAMDGDTDGGDSKGPNYQGLPRTHPAMKKARESVPKGRKGPRNEIKKPEQILRQRKLDEKKRSNNVRNMKKSKGKKGKG